MEEFRIGDKVECIYKNKKYAGTIWEIIEGEERPARVRFINGFRGNFTTDGRRPSTGKGQLLFKINKKK